MAIHLTIFLFLLILGGLHGQQQEQDYSGLKIIECPFKIEKEENRGEDFRLDGRPIESGNLLEGWEIKEFLGVVSSSSLHLLVSLSSSPSPVTQRECFVVQEDFGALLTPPPPPPPTKQINKRREERERREEGVVRAELCGDDRTAEYYNLENIQQWLFSLSKSFPELIEVRQAGKTEGDNPELIHHVILTNKASTKEKKKILFVHGLHAREWISISLGQGFIHHFLCISQTILDDVEIHLFPAANPEGYAFTWENSRMWRKNRKPSATTPSCVGTDLNRNFPDRWSLAGSSNKPCESIYHGDGPASEAETRAIVEVARDFGPFTAGIDFHAYGQLIVRPYDYTETLAPDEDFMKTLSAEMNETIYNVHSHSFTQFPADSLYPTSGSADGFLYSRCAEHPSSSIRALSLGIELRPTNQPGFLLPEDEIQPSLEEMWPALLLFLSSSLSNPLSYPPSPLSSEDVCICSSSSSDSCPSSLLLVEPEESNFAFWEMMLLGGVVVVVVGVVVVMGVVLVFSDKEDIEKVGRTELELEEMPEEGETEEGEESVDVGGEIGNGEGGEERAETMFEVELGDEIEKGEGIS